MGLDTSKYLITTTTQLKDTWYRLIFNNTNWKKIYDNVSTAPGSPTFQNFIKEKLLERGFLDVDFGSASSVSWMLDGVDDVRIRAEGGADSLNYFLDWTGILRVKIPKTNCIIKFKDKNNNVVLLTPENEQYQIGNINNGTWQSQYQKDLDPNLFGEERWVNLSRIGAEFAVAQDESSEIKNKGIFYLSSEDERYYQTDATNPSTDHKKWFSIPLYEVSFGIEQVEPYIWTTEQGSSWTPGQLKFPSMVKYSNILTEDNKDSGNAIELPETSSDTDASSYEQDENGYCYIKDGEGNIVYNKFLNPLARRVKINNGYRISGNQSLELLSFGNNIYNVSQKTEGQFLFKNDKKQNYGLKKDNNVTSALQQNIPYFGGQPAIYPIVIYNNMLSLNYNSSYPEIIKNSTSVIINNQSFPITEQDLVIYYVRNAISPDKITYKTKPGRNDFLPSFTWDKNGNATNVSFTIGSKTAQVDLDFKETNIWYDELPEKIDWTHFLTPSYSQSFGTIAQSIFESIIERDNLTFSMKGYMKHFPESWQFTANNRNWIYLSVGTFSGGGLSDAYFSIYASALQFPYIGNLSTNSSFTSALVKYNFEPDKWKNYDTLNFPLIFQVNTTPGVWPNLVGFFAEEYDKQSWTDSSGRQWTYFGRSYFDRKQYTSETGNNWVKYQDVQFAFEYRVTGETNKDICGYIEFENLSNPQAIAVVVWKNGKLLKNS